MNYLSKVGYTRCFALVFSLVLFSGAVCAQSGSGKVYPKDSLVYVQVIVPFEQAAEENGETPDWGELNRQLNSKYDAAFADRIVNKAQVFYDYGKDWPAFTAALVRYTEKYEDHSNLALLNKNAALVVQFSTDKKELETALGWSKHALEKDSGNADYQKTCDALKAKIAGN